MAAPANVNEFLDLVRKSGVVDEKRLDAHVQKLQGAGQLPVEPSKVAGILIRDGFLTHFQADNIMQGKWRRFTIGKYKVLERIGSGGMGQVYLCEHKLMRRRVAVKVLPTAKAADDSSRERFYREARAVAALDHINIVHAYDIDQDGDLHFLVMEYVDGANLQEIVKKSGPMDITRACHYVRQAALGLDHAHQANLVHRDIKPGNILVDRTGVVKVLDMGLARFFNDEEDILTKKYDDNVLGTADYLAPEQALDSHGVDIRADIYSLGATFFFILTGKTPFGEGTVAQKLIWHQTRQPKTLTEFRSDVPRQLQDILNKMMAKDPAQRYAIPAEVADALAAFTNDPIAAPPESEMPHLSLAASGGAPLDGGSVTTVTKVPPGPRSGKAPSSVPPGPKPPPNPAQQKSTAASVAAGRAAARSAPPPPTPVPAKPQVATLPTAAVEEDEKAPWENFAADTHGPTANLDTPSQSARSVRAARGEALAKQKEKRRLTITVIIVSSLLLVTVAILLWIFVINQPADLNTSAGRPPLSVSKDATKRYRSISLALQASRPGDVIEIYDDIHEENVIVDDKIRGVILQAAAGKEIRWVSARKQDEKTPLVRIDKAAGFTFNGKGIMLDGLIEQNRKLQDLIVITGFSPNITIEDLNFTNIGKAGVLIMNAQGDPQQPIRLLNLSSPDNAQDGSAGIALDAYPDSRPEFDDYIDIQSCFKSLKTPVFVKDNTVLGKNVSGIK